VPDVRQSRHFSPDADAISGFQTGSIIAVPLMLAGDCVGVLEAVRGVDKEPFEAANVTCLEMLAPHIAVALRTARITSELRETKDRLEEHNKTLEKKVDERTAMISRAKAEWERTFDAISEPLALLDGYTIRRTNLAYAERAGVDVKQVNGKPCYAVLAGRDSPCPQCPLAGRKGVRAHGELQVGTHGTYKLSAFPVSNSSDAAVVVHYTDVTAQRVLEAKLRENERLAAVGQLASGTAHEINNPLGFVISNLASLEDLFEDIAEALEKVPSAQELVDDGREMLGESLAGAKRVQAIVRALRDLSRLEIGRIEPSDVNGSVTRAVHAAFGPGQDAVVLALSANARAQIAPLQLDQVLSHLLDNAKKAVQPGQRIHLSSGEDERGVWVQVKDEGHGIAPEHLRRVFEPFFTTRGVGQGVGLGLTAAYGLVKRVGGDIEAHSEPGCGATFTVRLPRAAEPAVHPEVSHEIHVA
jgi:two-component system, NtrC family, sensor kinase